jgi:hypothetical protein
MPMFYSHIGWYSIVDVSALASKNWVVIGKITLAAERCKGVQPAVSAWHWGSLWLLTTASLSYSVVSLWIVASCKAV